MAVLGTYIVHQLDRDGFLGWSFAVPFTGDPGDYYRVPALPGLIMIATGLHATVDGVISFLPQKTIDGEPRANNFEVTLPANQAALHVIKAPGSVYEDSDGYYRFIINADLHVIVAFLNVIV